MWELLYCIKFEEKQDLIKMGVIWIYMALLVITTSTVSGYCDIPNVYDCECISDGIGQYLTCDGFPFATKENNWNTLSTVSIGVLNNVLGRKFNYNNQVWPNLLEVYTDYQKYWCNFGLCWVKDGHKSPSTSSTSATRPSVSTALFQQTVPVTKAKYVYSTPTIPINSRSTPTHTTPVSTPFTSFLSTLSEKTSVRKGASIASSSSLAQVYSTSTSPQVAVGETPSSSLQKTVKKNIYTTKNSPTDQDQAQTSKQTMTSKITFSDSPLTSLLSDGQTRPYPSKTVSTIDNFSNGLHIQKTNTSLKNLSSIEANKKNHSEVVHLSANSNHNLYYQIGFSLFALASLGFMVCIVTMLIRHILKRRNEPIYEVPLEMATLPRRRSRIYYNTSTL